MSAAAEAQALRFEHLVQINDPADLRIEALSREQLWRGLWLRAQAPKLFIPWLDEALIENLENGQLRRSLRFGSYEVRDIVHFEGDEAVRYEVQDSESGNRFELVMRIEEPAPQRLFVRFSYEAQSPDHRADNPLGDMVRSAYRHADEDTVFRIRQLAASGVLDAH